ncbi:hypothetical protein [Nonomuraea endophytica]|uniref:hypothetical protein n=1 Tax=Nonomuraea endophytica TaxID=714136 RepID=UPI0037C90EFC
MATRNNRGPQKSNQTENLRRDIKRAGRDAAKSAEREGVVAGPPPEVPDDVTLSAAQEAWLEAKTQAELYRKARANLDGELDALEEERQALDGERHRVAEADAQAKAAAHDLATERAALDEALTRHSEAERDLAAWRERLDRREKALNDQASEVEQGRLDAEAGFLEQEREHLRRLREQRSHMLGELEAQRKQLYADLDGHMEELDEQRRRRIAEFDQMRTDFEAELAERRAEEEARVKELKNLERQVRAAAENLEEDREYEREKAELAVAGALKRLELDRDRVQQEYAVVLQRARELEQQLNKRDESLRSSGYSAPEALHQRVTHLTAENEQLKQQIATMPGTADRELFEQTLRDHEQCKTIQARLEFANAKLRRENNSYVTANAELEELREHRDVLQHSVKVHQQLLSDKRAELDDLVSSAHATRPFPGLDELDDNAELQQELRVDDTPPDLAKLVEHIQQRILADRTHRRGNTKLAYRDRDIRCLLGGLAMSRLHLLQGISGIGKTTFPKAFAASIGAAYAVIEVQAGWRDRQDLVGHLNAFERRYYETTFTKAIYQAGCAAHKNRPFFVILDEMNLAHPEQYFADILSGLENVGSPMRLQLTTHAIQPKAELLVVDKGIQLEVPNNIWFFGTSNQDETTVQFADKTYDRANVIELPTTPPDLTEHKVESRQPVSRKALIQSFSKAWKDHRHTQEAVVRFLRTELAERLADDFEIGWGPRLEQQICDFAPVVVAAGGNIGEATDHILATRVLRRLQGRYSLRSDKLQDLRELIEARWPQPDKENPVVTPPDATKALLARLIEEKS